jgi:CRP-like cAMP-binding protein
MNIYIRTQELDLFKYLNDEQANALMRHVQRVELPAREYVVQPGQELDSFVILEQGELEIINASGRSSGSIYSGEIAGETCFPEPSVPRYSLRCIRDSSVILLSYSAVKQAMEQNTEIAARINAAINDSLCLKIIRITHNGDSND